MQNNTLQLTCYIYFLQPHLGSLYGTPSGMQSPGPHQSNFYGSGLPGSGKNQRNIWYFSLTLQSSNLLVDGQWTVNKLMPTEDQ